MVAETDELEMNLMQDGLEDSFMLRSPAKTSSQKISLDENKYLKASKDLDEERHRIDEQVIKEITQSVQFCKYQQVYQLSQALVG